MNVIFHGLKSRLVNGCKLDRIFTIFTMNNGKVNKYVVLNLLGSPSKIRNNIFDLFTFVGKRNTFPA